MHTGLEKKAVKGVVWSLTERFGVQSVQFIIGILLARLLMPSDFGLIGIIIVFIAFLQVLVDSGFSQSYIQKKEVCDADANTVFYSNLFISSVLYVLLWLSAPAIAQFYEQEILTALTRVMGVMVFINALGIIQIAQITRDVDFKKKTQISFIAAFISGICGVAGACLGIGVWALVLQSVLQASILVAGLWITSKWKPAWCFSISSFKEMFSFGLWVLLAAILRTVFDNIYMLTIGKFFPVAQLGFYTKAKQFQRLSAHQISGAVGAVAFPVFSQLQDKKIKLQAGMRKFLQHTLFFLVPLLVVLIVVAKPFIVLVLTEKWSPMIPYLQLLSCAGILVPIHQVNIQVLKAQGKSKLNFKLNLIKNSLRIINIAIMYRYSIIHIIFGEIALSTFALVLNTYYTGKMFDYGLYKQIKDVWSIIFAGGAAGLVGYAASAWIDNLILALTTGSVGTLIIYLGLQFILNRNLLAGIVKLRAVYQ